MSPLPTTARLPPASSSCRPPPPPSASSLLAPPTALPRSHLYLSPRSRPPVLHRPITRSSSTVPPPPRPCLRPSPRRLSSATGATLACRFACVGSIHSSSSPVPVPVYLLMGWAGFDPSGPSFPLGRFSQRKNRSEEKKTEIRREREVFLRLATNPSSPSCFKLQDKALELPGDAPALNLASLPILPTKPTEKQSKNLATAPCVSVRDPAYYSC
ncbi:hypothetical protein Taro_023225 [Colocasia esculenta]|uniref:Uncharacterized protein n=1 Tax=Colocasia esculenta TaxID=4460 RepID=A0A843VDV1_COLES|nr:hypothetical protein [Colocasia esculenta]